MERAGRTAPLRACSPAPARTGPLPEGRRELQNGGNLMDIFVFSWVNGLSDNWTAIISAVIQAVGTIAAALIAALCANRIVKGIKFHSYSDAPDNICSIMKKARSDIFIITAVGDKLLKTTEEVLERRLRSGIHVRYLLLDLNRFHEMETYMHGNAPKGEDIFYNALEALSRLQEKYPDRMEIRLFSRHMTASYVAIDTCPEPGREPALLSPFIQVMMYQYHVHAKNSVLLYFYEKTDKKRYDATADSMKDMWENASARLKQKAERPRS